MEEICPTKCMERNNSDQTGCDNAVAGPGSDLTYSKGWLKYKDMESLKNGKCIQIGKNWHNKDVTPDYNLRLSGDLLKKDF